MSAPETESMSERTKILYYVLWVMHPVLQTGIAGFMVRRGLLRNFKFFFGYIVTPASDFRSAFFLPMCGAAMTALFYLVLGRQCDQRDLRIPGDPRSFC